MSTARQESGGALRRASGRDRAEWFTLLDEWGAGGRPYREVADWLTGRGLSAWWAQKLIVEYEQARGLRAPGVRRDGSFAATASKTVAVPPDRALGAFLDSDVRARWLGDVELRQRTSRAGRSARFDCADGTRLNVDVVASSQGGCQVAVEHLRLADPHAAADAKAAWRQRLARLKELLEG